jgi:hypothetical protein
MICMDATQRFLVSTLLSSALLAAVTDARALDREWRAGGGVGAAHLGDAGFGPSLNLHGAYGLSDLFDLNLELLGSRHRTSGSADVLSAAAGISYKIDVFQWIPYVQLAGGLYYYGGDGGPNGESGLEPGASVGLGLDYLFSRSFSLGVLLREHASFSDGLSFPYLSGNLRAAYRWGW